MAKADLHSIDECQHWHEYAEPAHLDESWDEKVTRRLKKDDEAKWQLRVAVVCFAVWLIYMWPMIWRWVR